MAADLRLQVSAHATRDRPGQPTSCSEKRWPFACQSRARKKVALCFVRSPAMLSSPLLLVRPQYRALHGAACCVRLFRPHRTRLRNVFEMERFKAPPPAFSSSSPFLYCASSLSRSPLRRRPLSLSLSLSLFSGPSSSSSSSSSSSMGSSSSAQNCSADTAFNCTQWRASSGALPRPLPRVPLSSMLRRLLCSLPVVPFPLPALAFLHPPPRIYARCD